MPRKGAHYSKKPDDYIVLINQCNGSRFIVDATEDHEDIVIVPLKRKAGIAYRICRTHPAELAIFDSYDDASAEAELLAKKEGRTIIPPDEVMRRITKVVPKRRRKK